MKLCRDCTHLKPMYIGPYRRPEFDQCGLNREPVHGGPADFAKLARERYGHCGPEGVHFHPAPIRTEPVTFWERLFG
jgi:hypothetical protein